jgi:hypothetical protein
MITADYTLTTALTAIGHLTLIALTTDHIDHFNHHFWTRSVSQVDNDKLSVTIVIKWSVVKSTMSMVNSSLKWSVDSFKSGKSGHAVN